MNSSQVGQNQEILMSLMVVVGLQTLATLKVENLITFHVPEQDLESSPESDQQIKKPVAL